MVQSVTRPFRSALRLGGALVLFLAALAGPVTAQVRRPPAPPDTTARDTLPGDTIARDTVPGDTLPGDTTRVRGSRAAMADSIIRELRTLPGYVPTEYQGTAATYQVGEGVLQLKGGAQVQREGDQQLNADTIEYRQSEQLIIAKGKPKVSGQSQELTGRLLYYDLATHRATVRGAQTTVSQGANWIVRGDVTAEDRTSTMYATHGNFTTCDLEIPHYHFESDRIKVVKDKYLVARPARLYFGKVPVMVLPFVVQSLERGRRSGLIVPRFAITDIVRNSPGQTRQITDLGYYWAINDYLGAQATTTWRSGAYTSLSGNLDYNWRRQFLSGHLGYQRYWETDGGRNYSVNTSTSWRPDERTSLGVSGNYASSTRFIRRTTIDPREATQSLGSSLSLSRRFDWGSLSLGGTGQQQISDNSISMTLPSFSISPNSITFLRSPSPEQAKWYNNATLTWNLSGVRSLTKDKGDFLRGIQDRSDNSLQGGIQSFQLGNLSLSATGNFKQTRLMEEVGVDSAGAQLGVLPATSTDLGNWSAGASYQVKLIGQTSVSPTLSMSRSILRDSLTEGSYVQSPMRLTFGASVATALFGFYPGVGPFSAIRHRITPSISYGYSPSVQQSALQERVFGPLTANTQNTITLSFSQTFEGKLKEPRKPAGADSVPATGGDTTLANQPSVPAEPQKVTLLSINTSAIQYDFSRRSQGQSGFLTSTLSNSITSDYLHGLSVQIQHELFDRRGIDPNDVSQRGQLGSFSPRLTSLSTGFELGPSSAIFRWLGLGQDQGSTPSTQGTQPGNPPSDRATAGGQGSATGNQQSVGGGPWRVGLQYALTRQPRSFRILPKDMTPAQLRELARQNLHDTDQTVMADMAFSLTPKWAVTWNTQYSVADHEFAGHRLTFKRDLHRWQANFSFYQTPTGNSAFELYVELIDNPDLKVNYRDYNLGIDRR